LQNSAFEKFPRKGKMWNITHLRSCITLLYGSCLRCNWGMYGRPWA
jgi:hypothetical protein